MSRFNKCQETDCAADAEYLCSCSHFFCGDHYKSHSIQEGPDHQPIFILRPLSEENLSAINEFSITDLVKAHIQQEFQRRNESIQGLQDQIKQIEENYHARIKKIVENSRELELILLLMKQKQSFPLVSHSHLVSQISSLIQSNSFSFSSLKEVFSDYTLIHSHQPVESERPQTIEEREYERNGHNEEESKVEINRNPEPMLEIDHSDPKLLMQFTAHSGFFYSIKAVAVSSCKRLIASGGEDKLIKIWDSSLGRNLATLKRHTGAILTVEFNASTELLVSGSHDSTVIIWDLRGYIPLRTYNGHLSEVHSVCFSKDSKFIASGSEDTTIHLWRLEDASTIFVLKKHVQGVRKVIFSEGKRIISGSLDGKIIFWNSSTGKVISSLNFDFGPIHSFCLQDRILVCGGKHAVVFVVDLRSSELIRIFEDCKGSVESLGFTSCGQYIISGNADNSIKIWKWKDTNHFTLITDVRNPKVAISGKEIIAGDRSGKIRIWKLN